MSTRQAIEDSNHNKKGAWSKPRRSFVVRISAIYLLLTLINLIVFWTATGANQIKLITDKAAMESELFAENLLDQLGPFIGNSLHTNLLRNPQTRAIAGKRISDAVRKQISQGFHLINADGLVLYTNTGQKKVKSKTVRLILKSLHLKEKEAKPYFIEIDYSDYSADVLIPLAWTNTEIVFQSRIQLDSIKEELRSLFYLGIGMVLLLLVIQGLFGIILYRSLISPLRRLVQGAQRVATGDYKTSIENTNREDEIHQLITTFNSMVSSINEKTVQLNNTIQDLDEKDRVIQKELTMAQSIQKGIMPGEVRISNKIAAAVFYSPLEKVSGDYYDFFHLGNDSTGILMADASGHGIPAALITIMAKFYFSSMARTIKDPARLFYRVNEKLTGSLATTDYLTAFYGILQKNLTFTYSNASHENTLLIRQSRITELKGEGFMIGAVKSPPIAYTNQKIKLKLGDRLVFFTDGITEAENANGTAYGLKRFKAAVKKHKGLPISEMKEKLSEEIERFTRGAKRFDDVSIVIIELKANQARIKKTEKQAQSLVKRRLFKKAATVYEGLLKEEPQITGYKEQLAHCYFETGRFEEALQLYNELSRREKPAKIDFTRLYQIYRDKQKNILAIKSLQRALVHFPKAVDIIKNLCQLFIVENDRHAALRHIEMLEKLGKNSNDVKKLRKQLENHEPAQDE